jgi:hypothetical protein
MSVEFTAGFPALQTNIAETSCQILLHVRDFTRFIRVTPVTGLNLLLNALPIWRHPLALVEAAVLLRGPRLVFESRLRYASIGTRPTRARRPRGLSRTCRRGRRCTRPLPGPPP